MTSPLKSQLRLVTCGSVDDGKSTLMGRLVHDVAGLASDELAAISDGGAPDYAVLLDGLEAEREQGITIDVAWRYFASAERSYVVADSPGHEQYTRNMATAASNADFAVLIVDAEKGTLRQTRRHARILDLMGVPRLVLAVTKMDRAGYEQSVFDRVVRDFSAFAETLGFAWSAVPVSGVSGAMVAHRGDAMPWYTGSTLIETLDAVPSRDECFAESAFRMPVQAIARSSSGSDSPSRAVAGSIAGGSVCVGDAVRVLPSGARTRIAALTVSGSPAEEALEGDAITLTLEDHVDCARGDVIAAADDPPEAADQFEATLIWMGDEPLVPGRSYRLKCGTRTVSAVVREPKSVLDVDTGAELAAKTLGLNDIGTVEIATASDIVFEPFDGGPTDAAPRRVLGGFILIDKQSSATFAAGTWSFALRRSHNIHRQHLVVDREARARLKHQRPRVLWLTGLSAAGKSTIANLVEAKLARTGKHSFLLDGDNVRHGLSRDLGFTEADRVENIRRVGHVARLMADAGLIVICAFISPFRAERALVRSLLPEGEFVEIFVDAPLAEAEARDPKGLYKKARAGALANFTGIDSPYESPENPDIHIDTTALSAEEAADRIVAYLERE